MGTAGGALLGGTIGYMTPKDKEDKELRRRSALVGAGSGALMGGLGGALASSGTGADEVTSMVNKAHTRGVSIGAHHGRAAGLQEGYAKGQADLAKALPAGEVFTEGDRAEMLAELLRQRG